MSCENESGTREVSFTICCGEGTSGGEGGGEEAEGEVETGEVSGKMVHGGKNRTYIAYVPETWEAGMPLLLNLHGYTMTAKEQMKYGDFRGLADSEGFVIVHPQGLKDIRGTTCWNVGWTLPDSIPFVGGNAMSSTDDLGFLQELITEMETIYQINTNNVFSTGMSNGGFMSYHLACNGITTAVASVTGSMSDATYGSCGSSKPVLDIHGTGDGVVAYDGSTMWNVSTPSVIELWVKNNGCNPTPTTSTNGDIQHDVYSGGVAVEHYKIDEWGHDWPDWAAETVWDFFKEYIVTKPNDPNSPPSGKVESSKMAKHIGDTYPELLYPNDIPRGKTELKNCVPAIASPCSAPPC